MSKCLITGGAGFIGSHLSRALLELNNKVVVIDDYSTNAMEKIDDKIKTYKKNIENIAEVKKIFKREKPDIVYHLAGVINLRRKIVDPLFIKSLDFLDKTKAVLDVCRENNVKKLVFISSGGAIYEDARVVPTPHDYLAHPTSLYGLANLMIEKYIQLYCKEYRMNFIILRLSNVFGPRQWASGIIPSLIINLLREQSPIIYGDGTQTRDFIYIDDVVKASILALSKGKTGIFNVGSGEEVSLNEIFKLVKDILGTKIRPIYKTLVTQDQKRSALNIKKTEKELGWKNQINLKDGLNETVKWFQKNGKL